MLHLSLKDLKYFTNLKWSALKKYFKPEPFAFIRNTLLSDVLSRASSFCSLYKNFSTNGSAKEEDPPDQNTLALKMSEIMWNTMIFPILVSTSLPFSIP